jgi:HNH endonuclease/AP2 domain
MAKAKPLPSQAELTRLFAYDPVTGSLIWRIAPRNGVRAGDSAARPSSLGYLRAKWQKRTMKVHRVAWKIMTGFDPADEIDHINRNQADNRWVNLREADRVIQNNNRHIRRNTEAEYAETVATAAEIARQLAKKQQIADNSTIFTTNKSGVRGVYWSKSKNKWTAQISIGDKIRYLGRYDKIEDAKAAYDRAATVHFGSRGGITPNTGNP